MVYVMSDIHGQFSAYQKMLQMIEFSEQDDVVYIIGDVIDRGEYGIEILLDIMERKNIVFLLGNHEHAMLDTKGGSMNFHWLSGLCGDPTWNAFCKLSEKQKQAIYRYLESAPLELHIEVDGLPYHLVHGKPSRSKHAGPTKLLWERFERWEIERFPVHEFVVFGHTPTKRYQNADPMRIFFSDSGLIGIDCGCAYEERPGRLGCLRLNDWKEFYVDL